MSLAEMIASHPDVDGHLNESLAKAARHLMVCSTICASCADACVAEHGDMAQCVRSCSDCSDICAAAARVVIRRTAENEALIRKTLDLAAQACELCADECGRHDHEHCRRCAGMCRETAEDCWAATL